MLEYFADELCPSDNFFGRKFIGSTLLSMLIKCGQQNDWKEHNKDHVSNCLLSVLIWLILNWDKALGVKLGKEITWRIILKCYESYLQWMDL